jgi:hypothetical protein
MKNFIKSLLFISTIALFFSCNKDEGKLPNINFKSGATYTSTDKSINKGTSITIGIDASKAEDKDVLKKFNVSKSINGGTATTVFDKDLSGTEGDNYSYDYTTTVDTTVGQKSKYTFTVTNRDGLVNQVSLTVTAQ